MMVLLEIFFSGFKVDRIVVLLVKFIIFVRIGGFLMCGLCRW